jgi:protein-disulfide isomerase
VADDAGVVARVGGESVTATELDATMALRLHDLEMARYELRAARLRELLLARLFGPAAAADGLTVVEYVRREAAAAGLTDAAFVDAAFARAGVAIDLGPPEPPVIQLAGGDDPVRGPADAPVAIVVFCDFQSRYCRDMHPVLERLLAAYPTQVRLVARDFPLPVHRDAVTAAEAAACAGRQRAYWPYHDALLQDPGGLDRAALAARAHRVGIDVARLVACIDRREARADVEADAAEARRLGLSIVPTTFVDGRYLRGPQSYEALREQVDAALRRRGLAVPPPPAAIASGDQPGTAPAPPTSPPATQPGRVMLLDGTRPSPVACRRAASRSRRRWCSVPSPIVRSWNATSTIPPPISVRASGSDPWYASVRCEPARCTRRWASRRATSSCASTARCCSSAGTRCSMPSVRGPP